MLATCEQPLSDFLTQESKKVILIFSVQGSGHFQGKEYSRLGINRDLLLSVIASPRSSGMRANFHNIRVWNVSTK